MPDDGRLSHCRSWKDKNRRRQDCEKKTDVLQVASDEEVKSFKFLRFTPFEKPSGAVIV